MIDIYRYKDSDKLSLTDIDGETFIGSLISVNDVEDEDEDFGLKENSITLAVNNRPITFPVSEIKKIKIVISSCCRSNVICLWQYRRKHI